MLIFCDQVPIAESADFEVTSACPTNYPDKLIMCIFKLCSDTHNFNLKKGRFGSYAHRNQSLLIIHRSVFLS